MPDCPPDGKGKAILATYLFAFFVSIYLLTASGPAESDVGRMRVEVARSIIERLDLTVPSGHGIKGVDGRDYSWFGIGSVLLALPLYLAEEFSGIPHDNVISTMNQFVTASTVVLIFCFILALGYSKHSSLIVATCYGLGTMAWHYAKEPGDQALETFFVLLGVYSMYLYLLESKDRFLLLSGGAVGLAFLVRPTSLLVVPPLCLLCGMHLAERYKFTIGLRLMVRNGLVLMLAFLPFLGVACWYNYYRFGNIFETGYTLIAARMGVDFFITAKLFRGLAGFLVSPGKGFFYYSPIALLFFFSVRSFIRKHKKVAACFILTIMSYLLLMSTYLYWHGDWAWGPRLLLVITPFLIIPTAAIFDSAAWRNNGIIRKGVYALFFVSFIIQVMATSVDRFKYFTYLEAEKSVPFSIAQGQDVLPIVEPPDDTYFTWRLSHLLVNARFFYEMARNLSSYTYIRPPDQASYNDKVNAKPSYNIFDFWWLCKYYENGTKIGFMAAGALLLLAVYSAIRVLMLVKR